MKTNDLVHDFCKYPTNSGNWETQYGDLYFSYSYGNAYGNVMQYLENGTEAGWLIGGEASSVSHGKDWDEVMDSCSLWYHTDDHYTFSHLSIGGMLNRNNTINGIYHFLINIA